MPVNYPESVPSSNLVPSAIASGSGQSSFDTYDLSSDDQEYIKPNNVAETTPGRSDCTVRLLTAARLYLNPPPEAIMTWGKSNPNRNDNHSDPMELISTFWIPNTTYWWCQQQESHSKYADLSNVTGDRFSVIPHDVKVEASFSLGWEFIGWRRSMTTGQTLHKEVIVRWFVEANNGILAGCQLALDTTNTENDLEMMKGSEER